jgi:agmatine deiminase
MTIFSRTLPAEWHPQTAILLTFPHENSDWKPILNQVESVFINIAKAVCKFEQLIVSCFDEDHLKHVDQLLIANDIDKNNFKLYLVPSNDTWARDHSAICIYENNQRKILDFVFNGWGNKFNATLDNQITSNLHRQGAFENSPLISLNFVLEGGSIESDGLGTILTTEFCLRSPERNPQFNTEQVEAYLREWLGAQRILWLKHGALEGDDTDSHIDTLARFCDEKTIAYQSCEDSNDSHFKELKAMEEELQSFRQTNGEPYNLVALPFPKAKYSEEGQRLPATYANFLILNEIVLMPTYEDSADLLALERLQKCFPHRKVIGISCVPLIQQHGSLHCITMQLPIP